MRKKTQLLKRASVTMLAAAMLINSTAVTDVFLRCSSVVNAAEEDADVEHTLTDGTKEHTITDAVLEPSQFEEASPYEMQSFCDMYYANQLFFGNEKAEIDDGSDGIHIRGKNKNIQGQRLTIGKMYDFEEEGAGILCFDAISKRGKKVIAKFYLDDETTPFTEFKIPMQKKKDEWSSDDLLRMDIPKGKLTGKHYISIEFFDEDTSADKKTEVSLKSIGFYKQTGIPVMDINIDESYTPIRDMNEDIEHATECYGKIIITVPEGFSSGYSDEGQTEYTGGEYKLDYIRGRGNSTWGNEKKPYKIKLEEGANLFGMGTDKHWTLIANHFDNSLIRNRITYYLGEKLGMEYTPQLVPIDVNMNGKYIGSYFLCEQIRVGESRVNIGNLEDIESDSDDISGGYLLTIAGGYGRDYYEIDTDRYMEFYVESPNELSNINVSGEKLDEMNQYIDDYVRKTEEAIFGTDFKDSEGKSYTEYMDLDSAVKYYLIQQFSLNGDSYISPSTYLYKKKNGKLYWGPLWDFDYVAWSSYDYSTKGSWDGFKYSCAWLERLLQDDEFKTRLFEIWGGKDSRDPSTLCYQLNELVKEGGILDQYEAQMTVSAENNFAKWGMTDFSEDNSDENQEVIICESYHDEIERLRSWIINRMEWIDKNINKSCKCRFYDGDKLIYETETFMGDVKGTPEEPKKDGYVFDGWYGEIKIPEDAEVDFDVDELTGETEFSEDIQLFGDTDFYARWIPEEEIVPLEKIHVLEKEIYLEVGEGRVIGYSLIPENATRDDITFISSDESIVLIGYEEIVGMKEGDAEVTLSSKDGIKETILVHVIPKESETGSLIYVDTEDKDIQMSVGETRIVDFIAEPKVHRPMKLQMININPEVASMNNLGVLTAETSGKALIVVVYGEGYEHLNYITINVEVTADEDNPNVKTEDVVEKEPDVKNPDKTEISSEDKKVNGEDKKNEENKPDENKDTGKKTETKAETKIEKLKKGTEFEKGNLRYKVIKAGKLKDGKVTGGKVQVVGISAKGTKTKNIYIKDTISYKGNKFKITEVSNKAFTGNDNITKVTIGRNVTKIGKCAFNECENLKKLVIKGKNVKFKRKAFKGTNSELKAYVPAAKLKTYKKRLSKVGLTKEQVVRTEK